VTRDFDIPLKDPSEMEYTLRGLHLRRNDSVKTRMSKFSCFVSRHCRRQHVATITPYGFRNPTTGWPDLMPNICDLRHPQNMIDGCVHRVGREMLVPSRLDNEEAREYYEFTLAFVRKFVGKLADSELMSLEEALEESSYSNTRIEQLKRAELEKYDVTSKNKNPFETVMQAQAFSKAESFNEPKVNRIINSYSDSSKILLYAIIKSMEKKICKCGFFIKGTDPRTWNDLLFNMFGDSPVIENDFSSFESHHVGVFAEAMKDSVSYILSGLSVSPMLRDMIMTMLEGVNKMTFKYITVYCENRLMSGALWTSCLNGLLNLSIMQYLYTKSERGLSQKLIKATNFKCLVEGDDGIMTAFKVPKKSIDNLGINCDMDVVQNYTEASFCGITGNLMAKHIVTDPRRILRNFFVMEDKYKNCGDNKVKSLLRSKALSYKYCYPHLPIVGKMCDRILFITRGFQITLHDSQKYDIIKRATDMKVWQVPSEPTSEDRLLVSEKYGIDLHLQRELEDLMDKDWLEWNVDLSCLSGAAIDIKHMSKSLKDASDNDQKQISICNQVDDVVHTRFTTHGLSLATGSSILKNRFARQYMKVRWE